MGLHDAVSDDGVTVVCNCGRVFDGPRARDDHMVHWHLEKARAALKAGKAT